MGKNNRVNKITITHSIYFGIHTTLYQNYILLYCKVDIQIISNINVETKSNTVNKMTTPHPIWPEFILGYRYKILKIYLKN